MRAKRFPYSLYRESGEAILTMNCGRGVYRRRVMPLPVLRDMAEVCRRVQAEAIAPAAADEEFRRRVPPYPRCIGVVDASIYGVCDLSVVASRHGDAIEFCAGFYDEGDRRAPVLVLVDEEIVAFADEAEALITS